jgi:hypothetical protein
MKSKTSKKKDDFWVETPHLTRIFRYLQNQKIQLSMLQRIFFLLSILALATATHARPPKTLQEFIGWYSGTFTNTSQWKSDTTLPHYQMEVKEIWHNQKEEAIIWIFEQITYVNKPDVVFSQFFLKLSESGKGRYEMEIFTINSLFDADKMRKPDGFDGLSPDDLEPLGECVLAGKKADENKFNFATPNSRNCKIADFNGSYHLIDLSVYKEGKIFRKFDGFNDDGERVLGIKDDRGAIFIRKQPAKK